MGQVFKLQREESEFLGGLSIPQGGALQAAGPVGALSLSQKREQSETT